jgi:hypothetical protein
MSPADVSTCRRYHWSCRENVSTLVFHKSHQNLCFLLWRAGGKLVTEDAAVKSAICLNAVWQPVFVEPKTSQCRRPDKIESEGARILKNEASRSVDRLRESIRSFCDNTADSRRVWCLRENLSRKLLSMARLLVTLLRDQVFGEPRLVFGAERWDIQWTACVGPHVSRLDDGTNGLAN